MKENVYTVIIKVAYNDASVDFFKQLQQLIESKYPTASLVGYNEDLLKERKKAFSVKNGYAARKTPFAVILDYEETPIKAFYSEVSECTIDNIQYLLDSFVTYKEKENGSSSN